MATTSATIRCGNCGIHVAATIVHQPGWATFLLCPSCEDGSVKTRFGAVYPAAPAGGSVNGLPDDVATAWREVRTTFAVAAYTAAEMMCRKILMHLAVDLISNNPPGKKFAEYVTDLEDAGYVAPGLRPVVDKIRSRGNVANHELPASTEADAPTTLQITEHLIRTAYEMPTL